MKESTSAEARLRPVEWLTWLGVALFILWLFYSLSAYYVVQKPFTPSMVTALIVERSQWLRLTFSAAALARSLLDLGAALWLTILALGTGAWLWDRFFPAANRPLEAILFSLGLGFGSLGLGTLALGLSSLLRPSVIYALTILATILTLPKAVQLLKRTRLSLPGRAVLFYLLLTIGMALALALLPPTSWDGLFYHLKGPKLFLDAGRIRPGIDIPHLNFPSLFEMLFTLAMAIRGDVAAKLLHFVFSFMLAGLVFVMARDQLRVKNGWAAVVFLYATPMVLLLAGWAYNDLALAFYQVAALHALLRWSRDRGEGWLVLSGVMSGLGMGLKYTSFVAPLALAAIIVWEARPRFSAAIRPLAILASSAALVASPWYIKNLFFTGNPVYPFLFEGRFWDGFRSAAYAGSGSGMGFDILALLRLPHDLTLGLKDASQDGPSGPFFLAFLPLMLVYTFSRWRKDAPAAFRRLLFFALAQYLFWTMGVIFSAGLWQNRLLLPAYVALCPALAWMWQDLKRLDHPQFSLQRFLNLAIGFGLALALLGQALAWLPRAPLAYALGADSRDEVLRRSLGLHYVAMSEMNELLPEKAKVLFLWEPRSYYCDLDCRPDSILDTFSHAEHLYGDAQGMAAAWRREGITHVLIHEAGLDFVVEAGSKWVVPQRMSTLDELRAEYMIPVANWQEAYSLYRLAP